MSNYIVFSKTLLTLPVIKKKRSLIALATATIERNWQHGVQKTKKNKRENTIWGVSKVSPEQRRRVQMSLEAQNDI